MAKNDAFSLDSLEHQDLRNFLDDVCAHLQSTVKSENKNVQSFMDAVHNFDEEWDSVKI